MLVHLIYVALFFNSPGKTNTKPNIRGIQDLLGVVGPRGISGRYLGSAPNQPQISRSSRYKMRNIEKMKEKLTFLKLNYMMDNQVSVDQKCDIRDLRIRIV